MSTIGTILSRMMSEPEFADLLFDDAEKALVEYSLSADELAKFKSISRANFEMFALVSPEERKSLAGQLSSGDLATWRSNYGSGG